MEKIATKQNGEMAKPANPVHPVARLEANETIGKFAGAEQLRTAGNRLQSLLYAA